MPSPTIKHIMQVPKGNFSQFLFPCSVGLPNKPMNFLLDTGAEISIIKLKSIRSDVPINTNNIIEIKGLSSNSDNLLTMGSCIADVLIDLENSRILHS